MRQETKGAILFGVAALWLVLASSSARAQTGVSEDRVSLPEGPGSLEGVGENVTINTNMGAMSYEVKVQLPEGFPGLTPDLSLRYSSSGGESVVGVGWSLSMPSVERMTFKRLPRYERGDDFAVDGGEQLVRLPGTEPPVYRARYEGGFVRYTWVGAGDGAEGYWLAELPNGNKRYYGATAAGELVGAARVGGAEGTFKYMLVEEVDVYDHRLVYTWEKSGNYSLLTRVSYVFVEGAPSYEARLSYEERADEDDVAYLSSADGGFNLLLTQRLRRIEVRSRGITIRAYGLGYEPYRSSGGFTRLTRVQTEGAEGGIYPIGFDFSYSQALGGRCGEGDDCQRPFVVDMGSIGVTLSEGTANLIDINGDALPDILDASQPGAHRFFVNQIHMDGRSSFATEAVESEVGFQGGHRLGQATVQLLDVNGDGFTDLINASTGSVLINRGQGDWEAESSVMASENVAEALNQEFDAGEGGLQNLRFIDFNNDKRIDLMQASRAQTAYYQNMGEDGFALVEAAQALGVGFEEDNLQLADMNGDGQLDLVRVQPGSIEYRLNYGWGRWGGPVVIDNLPIGSGQQALAELEDINGDALADVVVVAGESVTYALNNNSTSFEAPVVLTNDGVEGSIPERGAEVTVLYADMNANGSSDIVWIRPGGQVDYLELFPVRPNLLTQITNNIGAVTDITYTTVAQEMARDGGAGAWRYRLPSPMNVVKELDQYDLLTDLHEVTRYTYRDGYYNGVEKQFRGFEQVQTVLVGDESVEEGVTRERFDVGAEDNYRHGLLLSSSVSSGGRALRAQAQVWEDCPLEGVTGETAAPIRYLCEVGSEEVIQEGQAEAAWVTTREERQYDGYGNVTRSAQLGVTQVGGGGCSPCGERGADEFGAPCGPQCLGDERYTEMSYVSPEDTGGRWILRSPYLTETYGRSGSMRRTEERMYYDGPDFVGLAGGRLTQGKLTRVTRRVSEGEEAVIEVQRSRYDEDGNVVEGLDPLGAPGGATHRRLYGYDRERLRVVRAELLTEDAQGRPYRLRRELGYDPLFDQINEATEWLRVVDGAVESPLRGYAYGYDEFGRMVERFLPGNSSNAPDERFVYVLESPASQIVTQKRSAVGGGWDMEQINCLDGRGRSFQARTRLGEGLYQVTGLTRFNLRSQPVEVFEPYQGASAGCDAPEEVPRGTRSTRSRYDATFRLLEEQIPDAEIFGAGSVKRMEYGPLVTRSFDLEDNDPGSAHFGTPLRVVSNGLGQVVEVERSLGSGEGSITKIHYDSLGYMTGYTDAEGNRKEQVHDLLGRVLRIVDPNSADVTEMRYDAASNVVWKEDDRGVVTRMVYDGLNRQVASWDEADEAGTKITWAYDYLAGCALCTFGEDKVVEMSWPDGAGGRGVDRLGYDQRGRAVWNERQIEGYAFGSTLAYDNADRVVRSVWPDGQVLAQVYDPGSRVVAIEGVISEVSYDGRGLMRRWVASDGSQTEMGYDAVQRMNRMVTRGAPGVLQDFTYTHDRMGNIVRVADGAGEAPGRPRYEASHEYDAWYRVSGSMLEGEALTFGFDVLDNVTEVRSSLGSGSAAHVGELEYASYAPNAVTAAGGEQYEYDMAGNVVARGDQRYTWDFMGRLTEVRRVEAEVARFVYGASQSRVIKREGDSTTIYVAPGFEVRDGISALYVKLDRHRVARLESAALATALYTDHDGDGSISAADALLEHREGSASGPVLWSSVRRLLLEAGPDEGAAFLHHDHLGSLTLATGLVGGEAAVLGQRNFTPLGLERGDGSGYVDEYGFTGQELDRATGLVRFDWRYYDPKIGRWMSIDPAFSSSDAENVMKHGEGTTGYAYVANNFLNAFDPTGLEREGVILNPDAQDAEAASRNQYLSDPKNQIKETYKAEGREGVSDVFSEAAGEANNLEIEVDDTREHGQNQYASPSQEGIPAFNPGSLDDIRQAPAGSDLQLALKLERKEAKEYSKGLQQTADNNKAHAENLWYGDRAGPGRLTPRQIQAQNRQRERSGALWGVRVPAAILKHLENRR